MGEVLSEEGGEGGGGDVAPQFFAYSSFVRCCDRVCNWACSDHQGD